MKGAEEPQTRSKVKKKGRTSKSDDAEKNRFYIVATSPLADEATRVLKHGDTFAVFDHYGDITTGGLGEQGVYHEGTRFLSSCLLRLGELRPLFLSSTVKEDNDLLAADLTNPDISDGEKIIVPRGVLHFSRVKILWDGVCYERLRIRNYGLAPVDARFSFDFAADFADIFEVRGTKRRRRGEYLDGTVAEGAVTLAYRGLDRVVRRTRLTFAPVPASLSEEEARFEVSLSSREERTFCLTVACEVEDHHRRVLSFEDALAHAMQSQTRAPIRACRIHTSNTRFNDLVNRTVADVHMMITNLPTGPYPYAGVPWFSTPFGRDGIITALECLWLDPGLAKGVLAFLAATQARDVNPEQDAEPGKILHEMRRGEMAALGEIPFGRYYGSVDATPLFIILAGAYYLRSGDRSFLSELWPSVEAALHWIDHFGDKDGDGFVEYERNSPQGLVHQGWKDSRDSIFHADGKLAQGPIALCEVQGYVFAAKRAAAELAAALDHGPRADELAQQALAIQEHFEQAFWCDDLKTYALGLDGEKRPCRVRASNAGHCLFTGIASTERARYTAQTLLGEDSFSGWGIRTLAAGEARYNPMSYHNGSVWPHDNALISAGLARYGFKDEVVQILNVMADASLFFDLHRLPELFCGFPRRAGEGPTLYPVACAPQAWSAAAVFMLLQASLGLRVDARKSRISFSYPLLPASVNDVRIHNLRVNDASVDLLLQRYGQDVGINVLRREGNVDITMVK
jgi:glycogen debranching enzyme